MMIIAKLQYKIHMLEMLNLCFTIDQNEFPQVGPKYFIHQFLECGRRISDSKGHEQNPIVAIMCA